MILENQALQKDFLEFQAVFAQGTKDFLLKNIAKCNGEWLSSAEQGYIEAQYHLGWLYYEGKGITQSFTEAIKWFQLAAEQGHPWAQVIFGIMYTKGEGTTQNFVEAAKWYLLAAEQNAYGQLYIGVCYENGSGVSKNLSEAVRWFQFAAEQGNSYAQEWLDAIKENNPECIKELARKNREQALRSHILIK